MTEGETGLIKGSLNTAGPSQTQRYHCRKIRKLKKMDRGQGKSGGKDGVGVEVLGRTEQVLGVTRVERYCEGENNVRVKGTGKS